MGLGTALAIGGSLLGLYGAKRSRDQAQIQQQKIDEYNQQRYDDYLRSLQSTLDESAAILGEQSALQQQGHDIVSGALPYYQPQRYYPRIAFDTHRREQQFHQDMQAPGLTQELLNVSPTHAGDVPGPYNARAASAESQMMNEITEDLENRAYVGAMSYNPTREANYAQNQIAVPLAVHNTMMGGQVPIYQARMQRAGLQIPADPLELNPSGTPDAIAAAGAGLANLGGTIARYGGTSTPTPAPYTSYTNLVPRAPMYPGAQQTFSNPWWV